MNSSERIDQAKRVPARIWRWIKRAPGCSSRWIKSLFVGDSAVKPLARTWTAWAAGLIPLVLSATAAIFIYRNDPTLGGFSLTAEGFNQAFTHFFRVPLLILSASVALLALVAYNHRSEQTARSIEEQQSQNRFSNYFTHIREFSEYARTEAGHSEFMTKAIEEHVTLRHVYRWLYPNSSPSSGDFLLPESRVLAIEHVTETATKFRDILAYLLASREGDAPLFQDDEVLGYILTNHHSDLSDALRELDGIGKICNAEYSNAKHVPSTALKAGQTHCEILAVLCSFDGSTEAIQLRQAFRVLRSEVIRIQKHLTSLKVTIKAKTADIQAEGKLRELSGE